MEYDDARTYVLRGRPVAVSLRSYKFAKFVSCRRYVNKNVLGISIGLFSRREYPSANIEKFV
jgi:hypothetical protein